MRLSMSRSAELQLGVVRRAPNAPIWRSALPGKPRWFMGPMHAEKTKGGFPRTARQWVVVPPVAGASRPNILRGRDAREGSRDGCATTDRSRKVAGFGGD